MGKNPSLTLGVLLCAASAALASAALASDEAKPLKSDSDAPYVHRLTLYDHNGEVIDPTDDFAGPYSPKQTCGKCHPYADIHAGWHFNAADPDVPPGRIGEPWWLIDEATATQIPISLRNWRGVFSPKDAGLTHWQMVKRFGRHIPGGGFGEPSDETIASEPESLRWNISGKLEIDCMFCHAADSQHDPAEAARQIERENFKWAPTAALGLASIRGDASKAPDDWDPMLGPDPDNPEASGPSLEWNLSRFDADDRVLFDIAEQPPAEKCLFCHSSHEVGPGAPPEIMKPRDVHLTAGMTCVDCHRNGEDHKMVRGYEAEAAETGEPERAAYSCRGCHLGVEDADDPELALGGHFGAPHPQHKGLPPIHFEKLTCTACHSGPWPEMDAKQFQTSLAHGLGLASRERKPETLPKIVEPVFGRQSDGRIAPQRFVLPAFWGRSTKNSAYTLMPFAVVSREIANAIGVDGDTSDPHQRSQLSAEETKQTLSELAADDSGVYVSRIQAGKILSLSEDSNEIEIGQYPNKNVPSALRGFLDAWFSKAAPSAWSIAHGVRPALQSLGVRECTDCHANESPMFFGVAATTGGTVARESSVFMLDLRDEDTTLARAWAFGFIFRPVFKWITAACVLVLVFLMRRAMMTAANGPSFAPASTGFTAYDHLIHVVAIIGVAIQTLTGPIAEWFFGGVHGWTLFVHMLGAPLFVVGTTLVAWRWAPRFPLGRNTGGQAGSGAHAASGTPYTIGQRWMFWVCVLLGFWVIAPMLAAMFPMFGYAGQEVLIEVHEIAAILFVIAMIVHTLVSLAAKRSRSEPRA